MKGTYSLEAVSKLIDTYISKGGEALQTDEGVLMHGDWLLYDLNGKLKFIVIKEVYVNEWTSRQTVRKYNKIPKKYFKVLDIWK